MLWYGLKKLKWTNEIKNLKLGNKLKTRTLNINFPHKINLNTSEILLYVPHSFNLIIFNLKISNNFYLIYLYSDSYFFFLPFRKFQSKFYFSSEARTLNLLSPFTNNFFLLYWTSLKSIFFSFSRIFFKRLKFRGKGYYIYKNKRNTVAPQFGYSHMIRMYGYVISLKFITKTIIFVYGINKFDILNVGRNIFSKRPHNIFTGKGVRFSKQIIYKKTGKISSYR